MATYIDFSSEEEQALSLSQFLNQAKTKGKEADSSFYDTCAQLVSENKYVELWSKLIEESPALFAETSEKDVEGFFAAITSLVNRLSADSVHQILPKILTAVATNHEERPLLRLKILGNIYNILNKTPADRFTIFTTILDVAGSTKHPEVVVPHLKDIERRITQWGIDAKLTRDLYKKIRDLYKQAHKSNEAHKWTVSYLNSYETTSEESTREAVAAALDAIRLPDLFQIDTLLSVPAIKQLEKDPKNAKLYHLLTIFVGENLDAFKVFTSVNSGYLKEIGVDEEEATKKMRYLSLVSLASLNHEISYSTIAKILLISESDVEFWVMSAIGEGLLEAKMDQLKGIVRVTRSLQRIFTRAQWKYLSDNLSTWKKNIQILLTTLEECKQSSNQQALDLAKVGGDVTQI